MSLNPGRVELGVRSTSVPSRAWTKNIITIMVFWQLGYSKLPQVYFFIAAPDFSSYPAKSIQMGEAT